MREYSPVKAPHGPERTCKSWGAEAAMRMLMNNLDEEVAEDPRRLVVYGGSGRAARSWEAFDAIVAALKALEPDETLLIQSGKPVGVFRTHAEAPRVLIANSLLVPHWASWEHFHHLDRRDRLPDHRGIGPSRCYLVRGHRALVHRGGHAPRGAATRLRDQRQLHSDLRGSEGD